MISNKDQLKEIADQGLYRKRKIVSGPSNVETVIDGKKCLTFCSNDYLGLANDSDVKHAFVAAAKKYGVGSGSAHLVTGHTEEHHKLEEELADFFGRERALVYSTGYMANLGIISCLTGRGDVIFEDKLNHASLLDGAKLSDAKLLRYSHVSMEHLEKRYEKYLLNEDKEKIGRKLIVTDGVFSMDGDIAPLDKMSKYAHHNNAVLMVDDAHGIGVLGANGRGTIEHYGLGEPDVPVLMGTLGKSFGTFGSFVVGSNDLVEMLIQKSRTYIFTTAMPAAIAAATRVSLRKVLTENWRREQIYDLIAYFNGCAKQIGLETSDSITPIQPLIIGDPERAVEISNRLAKKGVVVSAIRPPTVPRGTSRLRVTFSAQHAFDHVDRLIETLKTELMDKE